MTKNARSNIPGRRFWQRIQGQLFLLLLVSIVPILLVQVYVFREWYQARLDDELQANLNIARTVAKTFDNFIASVLHKEYAIGLALTKINPDEQRPYLEKNVAEYPVFLSLAWLTPDGVIRAFTYPEGEGQSRSDREYFQDIVGGREWTVSDLMIGRVSKAISVVVARGIRSERGELLGIVLATLAPERFDEVLAIDRSAGGGHALVDRKGVAVYRYPRIDFTWEQRRNVVNDFSGFKDALAGKEVSTLVFSPYEKNNRLAAFAPISSIGWAASAGCTEAAAMGPYVSKLRLLASFVLLVTLGAFVFAFVISRRISQPIKQLRDSALALGRGEDLNYDTAGPIEVRDLAASLDHMAKAVRNREEALRESKSKLEVALASMTDAVFISDAQGRFIDFNDAFAAYHRFRNKDECLETLAEYPDILDVFMENGQPAPLDMWAVPRALRGETVTNAVYALRRKDTGERWIGSYSFAPIRDKEGAIVGSVVVGRDVTEQKYAEEALRQREEEFRALVENAPDVISLFDRNLRRIYVNAMVKENTGVDASFMTGKSLAEAGYPDSFTRPLNAALRSVFATGLEEMVELEYEAPKGRIWLEIRCAPVRDADGSVLRVMTIGRDITNRKKAAIDLYHSNREKTALLKEVHHRVKNNLQIVASLLGLQAGRSDSPRVLEVLRETRGRVRSMALLHETLYRSGNLARINLASYLKDLCLQLLASSGPAAARVKLDFRIAAVGLPLEPALPCGLIVNELVSNALKHGFPGDRAGKICISLEPVGEQALALSVRDEGVGLPPDFNPASTTTLGMRLVTGLVAQLRGQLRVETPQGGGVSFCATFPFPADMTVGGES